MVVSELLKCRSSTCSNARSHGRHAAWKISWQGTHPAALEPLMRQPLNTGESPNTVLKKLIGWLLAVIVRAAALFVPMGLILQ